MLGGVRSVVGDDSETSFAGRSDGFDGVPESGETDWFSTLKFTTDDSGSSSESESMSESGSMSDSGGMYNTDGDEEWARHGAYSPSSNSNYSDSESNPGSGSVVGDSLDAERAGGGWEAGRD